MAESAPPKNNLVRACPALKRMHELPDASRVFTLSDFDFQLPAELIAQHPSPVRSASRLLDGRGHDLKDRIFHELPALLQPGDLLVFNDTQVMKARLFGHKPSGGKLELLVERVLPDHRVVAHMKVSKKPAIGTVLQMDGGFFAELLGRWPTAQGPLFQLRLSDDPHRLMERHGHVPLPPYISHDDTAEDVSRYQTVFAARPGAAAAPTAALHFDDQVLQELERRGVQRAHVTLHVGAGTFSPVKTEHLADHRMHSEWYEVSPSTLQALAATKARGGRIVAVGTTTVRTLESWARAHQLGPDLHALESLACSTQAPYSADTDIFITPGFQFILVDLLITNFHLPKSTLMMLVSAFAGYQNIKTIYQHAIDRSYRFFSYGDAMLLQRQA